MSNVCSFCKVESYIIKDSENISYKGKKIKVEGLSFYECPECEEQFVDSNLDKANAVLIREAKKEFDGLLSSVEVSNLREKLNITQHEAAKIFGGGLNAFSKYERGEVSQSESMDKLMRASLQVEGLFDWLREDAGIKPANYSRFVDSCKKIKSFYSQLPKASQVKDEFEVLFAYSYAQAVETSNEHAFEAGKHDKHEMKSYKTVDFFVAQSCEVSEVVH